MLPQLLALWKSGSLAKLLQLSGSSQKQDCVGPASGPAKGTALGHRQSAARQPSSLPGVQHTSGPAADGWTTVKSRKPQATLETEADTLPAEGWSVQICPSFDELKMDSPGVCLGSTAAVRRALQELSGQATVALAILGPSSLEGKGQLLQIQVANAEGKLQSPARYLFQLGPQPVSYASAAPRRSVLCDTGRVVLNLKQGYTEKSEWDFAIARGGIAANAWLKKLGVQP